MAGRLAGAIEEERHGEPVAWEEMAVADLHYPLRMYPGTGRQIPVSVALADLRARVQGRAYGWDDHPGAAFHKAVSAALGVRPDTDGLYTGIARSLGTTRTNYHNAMHHGFPLRAVLAWCRELSLDLVALHSGLIVVCAPRFLTVAHQAGEPPAPVQATEPELS